MNILCPEKSFVSGNSEFAIATFRKPEVENLAEDVCLLEYRAIIYLVFITIIRLEPPHD